MTEIARLRPTLNTAIRRISEPEIGDHVRLTDIERDEQAERAAKLWQEGMHREGRARILDRAKRRHAT